MYKNSQFAISVLQIIILERITAHLERWNKVIQQQNFKVGDVVKSHIQVQSKAKTGEVKKLYYQARGTFQVKTGLGNNSYEVKNTMKHNLQYGSTRVHIRSRA